MTTPQVRIGILGTAKIARSVAPAIHAAPEAQLAAIAGRDPQKAAAFADEFRIPTIHQSFEQLLNDPDIDAVYIPLPPSLHCEWTLRACEADKHVLCEKPLGMDSADAEQMMAACIHRRRILLDGVMWYHTLRATALKQVVAGGQLGRLSQLTSVFTFPGDRLDPSNLRLHRETGGGSLLDIGWYCVGVSLWLAARLPLKVSAAAVWKNDVDLHLNGLMWFDDDLMASLECGFTAVRRRWMEVAGTRAALFCDDFTRPWDRSQPAFRVIDGDGSAVQHVYPERSQEECWISAFCQLIHAGRWDHPWLQLAVDTQRVCEALATSARTGSVIRLED